MGVLADLRSLSAVEQFFAYLNVSVERRALHVARLPLLRRMDAFINRPGFEGLPEGEVFARCRAHLEAAYEELCLPAPLDEEQEVEQGELMPPAEPPRSFYGLDARDGGG